MINSTIFYPLSALAQGVEYIMTIPQNSSPAHAAVFAEAAIMACSVGGFCAAGGLVRYLYKSAMEDLRDTEGVGYNDQGPFPEVDFSERVICYLRIGSCGVFAAGCLVGGAITLAHSINTLSRLVL